MADPKKTVWLPFLTPQNEDTSGRNMQMNPFTAAAQSDSKQNIRMMMTAGTLMAVFAVVMFGTTWVTQRRQNTAVGAMVNIKNAVQGIVTNVDYTSRAFTLGVQSSTNAEVSATKIPTWSVTLAPGASFETEGDVLKICYSVSDLERSLADAATIPCGEIVKVGKTVVVEYVTIDTKLGAMTAKSIYGSM